MSHQALQRLEAALARVDEFAASLRVISPLDPEVFPVSVDRADLRALLEERRWISVQEELPEVQHAYLICLLGMEVCDAWLNKAGKWEGRGGRSEILGVTHWMPLPQPSQEGEVK